MLISRAFHAVLTGVEAKFLSFQFFAILTLFSTF